MPRLPNISKYWVSCCSAALASLKRVRHADTFDRRLLHTLDGHRLGQSRGVEDGRRNVDYMVELVRIPPFSLIPFGQCTIVPLRVPPQCEATCLVHW